MKGTGDGEGDEKLLGRGGEEACAGWLELESRVGVETRMGGNAEYRVRSFGPAAEAPPIRRCRASRPPQSEATPGRSP